MFSSTDYIIQIIYIIFNYFKDLFDREDFLKNLEKQTKSLNINLNLIESSDEYETFTKAIKPKTLLSLSIAAHTVSNKSEKIEEKVFIQRNNEDPQTSLKFYGITVCLDTEKIDRKVHFLLFKKNKEFMKFVKKILEREDVIKILFFAKQHYKLIYEMFNFDIKLPCYDPIVADWLINQENSTIYQMKQKYSPNFNIPINYELRKEKSCFGCTLVDLKSKDCGVSKVISRSILECLLAINCFDRVKLQLQLQNLWIYYAKIESEIVLIVARIEIHGMGKLFKNLFFIEV